jgi:hypothetical protein
VVAFETHATAVRLEVIRFASFSSETLSNGQSMSRHQNSGQATHLRSNHVVRDAPEVRIQEPVDEGIPKSIAERKPRNDELQTRRNL